MIYLATKGRRGARTKKNILLLILYKKKTKKNILKPGSPNPISIPGTLIFNRPILDLTNFDRKKQQFFESSHTTNAIV